MQSPSPTGDREERRLSPAVDVLVREAEQNFANFDSDAYLATKEQLLTKLSDAEPALALVLAFAFGNEGRQLRAPKITHDMASRASLFTAPPRPPLVRHVADVEDRNFTRPSQRLWNVDSGGDLTFEEKIAAKTAMIIMTKNHLPQNVQMLVLRKLFGNRLEFEHDDIRSLVTRMNEIALGKKKLHARSTLRW